MKKNDTVDMHRRVFPIESVETRAGDDSLEIEGYALTWADQADFGWATESFAPGAFLGKMADTRLLADHRGLPFARADRGTLEIEEDAKGLRFVASLDPERRDAADLHRAVRRGDVSSVSVGFIMRDDSIVETTNTEGKYHDTIKRVTRLNEISLVDRPAYTSSEVHPRRLGTNPPEDVEWTEYERSVFRRIKEERLT